MPAVIPVRLNDRNNWRFVWDDLEKGHYWTVIEKEVPDGYYSSTDIEGITFVITNKAENPDESEDLPENPPSNDTKDFQTDILQWRLFIFDLKLCIIVPSPVRAGKREKRKGGNSIHPRREA